MKRRPFLPGRDPRHREAVFALYRNLIREASRVPLPEARLAPGAGNPLQHFIRKRLVSNRPYTSSRLVYAAMVAGYQFIDTLIKARSNSTPEHARILEYLNSHPYHPPRPSNSDPTPKAFTTPRTGLLTRVASADGTYKYVPTKPPGTDPRWLTRRLPHIGKTSENQTFIRFGKPQPVFLTRKLIKQRAISVKNVSKVKHVENDMMAAARDEDMWEEIVARQMELEGSEPPKSKERIETSYRWGVAVSKLWHLWKWEKRWYDICARGDGHQAFLDEIVKMRRSDAQAEKAPIPSSPPTSKVKTAKWGSTYPLLAVVKELTGKIPMEVEADPFAAPHWALLVENRHWHLMKLVPPLEKGDDGKA